MRHRIAPSLALAVNLSLAAGLSPALAQLDPATTAMAAQYAQTAQTCMQHSVLMAVRAGQRTKPALLGSTTARCGNDWLQFLIAHGDSVRQSQAELSAMANRVIDETLKTQK
jgi:hypothetical protein